MLLFLLFQYTHCAMEKYTEVNFPLLIAGGIYQNLSKPWLSFVEMKLNKIMSIDDKSFLCQQKINYL